MYFELRANDDTDHFAWLGNPDYDTGVADTILMELHPKGYLQKPLQPSFHTGSPNGSGNGAGEVWYNTSAIFSNVGSHYNNSNGRFTAPVAGTYIFYGTGIKSSSTTTTTRYYIKRNGSYVHNMRHLRLDGGNVQTYGDNGTMQWMVTCSAGDYIQAI